MPDIKNRRKFELRFANPADIARVVVAKGCTLCNGDFSVLAYTQPGCRSGYTRVIVEKPFGKDSESFRQLSADLYQHLTEDQMYRIDHYLGKELIENLTVRFALLPIDY